MSIGKRAMLGTLWKASVFERTLNSSEYKAKTENIMVKTQNVSFTAPDLQQLANIALEAMLIFPHLPNISHTFNGHK